MKLKICAYVGMMFGLTALMAACGGGGGGGPAGTLIPVTASKNPALVGSAVTITANFTTYTSTAKFGSNRAQVGKVVNFTTNAPAAITAPTTIQADFTATATLNGPVSAVPANFTATASYNTASGSTTVTFIPQPGSASVLVVPKTALAGVGYMQCDVTNDLPALFRTFSTAKNPTLLPPQIDPDIVGMSVSRATGSLLGSAPYDLAASQPAPPPALYPLFKFSYNIPAGVPIFAIDLTPYPSVGNYFAPYATPRDPPIVPVPVLLLKPTYFSGPDETGTVLYAGQ